MVHNNVVLRKAGRKDKNTGKGRKQKKGSLIGRLLSLLAAVVLYFYYQSAIQMEVSFILPLAIQGQEGRVVSLAESSQEVTLHLAGQASQLENLRSSDFEAYIRLNPSQEGQQQLPISYRLRNNDLKLGKAVHVQIEPPQVTLVVEKEEAKELPIELNIQGYPAIGFSLGAYRVYPATVTVIGAASVLQKLDVISTSPINITGKSKPFQKLVELKMPSLRGVERPLSHSLELALQRVQVDIQISARTETKTLNIEPRVTGLPRSLKLLNILPSSVRLTLQGDSDILQDIEQQPDSVIIELDAGDIFTSGRYALPIVVSGLPAGVSLLNSTPNRVSLMVDDSR